MQIKVEESNGVKKYFVNGKQYDRLEDIPEEFKSYFVDKNNNGIPDQFDSLFDSMQKNPFSFKTFKSLLQASPILENKNQPINKLENGNPFLSTLFKILVAIAVAFLVALSYFIYQRDKNRSTSDTTLVSKLITQTEWHSNSFEAIIYRTPRRVVIFVNPG